MDDSDACGKYTVNEGLGSLALGLWCSDSGLYRSKRFSLNTKQRPKTKGQRPNPWVDTGVRISSRRSPVLQSTNEQEVHRETIVGSIGMCRIVCGFCTSGDGLQAPPAVSCELRLSVSAAVQKHCVLSQLCNAIAALLCLQGSALFLAASSRRAYAGHRQWRGRGCGRFAWRKKRGGLRLAGRVGELGALYVQTPRQAATLLSCPFS